MRIYKYICVYIYVYIYMYYVYTVDWGGYGVLRFLGRVGWQFTSSFQERWHHEVYS